MSLSERSFAPGSTIGILGGGQLGRMLAMAAANLGYRVHVLAPEPDSPAMQVAAASTVAAYEDAAALRRFAKAVDLVTFEFENVPLGSAEAVAALRPLRPGPKALGATQDRLSEKQLLQGCGIAAAPFAPVSDPPSLKAALQQVPLPAVLKTRRLGYDGKGQVRIQAAAEADDAWERLGRAPAILEQWVPFEREISVLAARGLNGEIAAYAPVENRHEAHILRTSLAPAPVAPATAEAAADIARRVLEALDYVGLLAVELFALPDGALLANEIAPRVHNSGHWSIEGAETSQFEQHIRAICGLPLGSTELRGVAEMHNLLGEEAAGWPRWLAEPGWHLHLYGKGEARPGRKMGHVTRVRPAPAKP